MCALAGRREDPEGRHDGSEGLPGGGGDNEGDAAPEPGGAAGRVHARAALLHHHGVHVPREPARLPAVRQPRVRARRRRAHAHGHTDRLRDELPREQILHTQVSYSLSHSHTLSLSNYLSPSLSLTHTLFTPSLSQSYSLPSAH